jgi:hypothetical protein
VVLYDENDERSLRMQLENEEFKLNFKNVIKKLNF